MTVLERILELKEERNWSEYRLSEESGIAQTTISSWFRKNINPTITSLESLCRAFNITMSQFFAFDDDPAVLTKEQIELLNYWNRLDMQQQKAVLEVIKNMH